MSKVQRLIDRYDEIAEKAGFVIASFGLEIQDRDKRIADLVAENERLENLLAEGVHSCSQTCKRPMCVLRREKSDMMEALTIIANNPNPPTYWCRDVAVVALKEQDNGS